MISGLTAVDIDDENSFVIDLTMENDQRHRHGHPPMGMDEAHPKTHQMAATGTGSARTGAGVSREDGQITAPARLNAGLRQSRLCRGSSKGISEARGRTGGAAPDATGERIRGPGAAAAGDVATAGGATPLPMTWRVFGRPVARMATARGVPRSESRAASSRVAWRGCSRIWASARAAESWGKLRQSSPPISARY